MRTEPTPAAMVAFWREAGPDTWFAKDDAFDAECRRRFFAAWEQAARGKLSAWEATAEGALALILLLDQMPRNMFRGDARTWSSDPLALAVAERAIARGFDAEIPPNLRAFVYLPFEHAEDLAAQARSVALFTALGAPEQLKWAKHHHAIIARFGRFPHRNAALGRDSTPEELAYLEEDDFRG
jgi:uncharacterized protein (DUF924 family)